MVDVSLIYRICSVIVFLLILSTGIACADRLPFQVPENQKISISTIIDVIGFVSDKSYLSWTIDYLEGSETTDEFGSIHDGRLYPGESIAIASFSDSIMTNGGHLMLNKDLGFDSQNKGKGLNNLEVEKVLTYESIDGSFLVGSEEWSLDVAGNYAGTDDSIRCVFASARENVIPAFCNVVKARSELINFNSGQVSTKGGLRAVAATGDVPAGLFYQIAVSPIPGYEFAEGTVKTGFAGSIMEARGKSDIPSVTNQWSDKASVSGGIRNFQKSFGYESGITY
ncbi:MAG: hypothetical protein LC132_09355 [Burkholderiales bacterium]|jgi:hypothetical protein|nr:hypothetical protein [Burkholderiales bacterium]OQB35938.1 MAG: hypothetical protein BWY05_01206 [Euryarchaeota archaeon ADurb.Bin165]